MYFVTGEIWRDLGFSGLEFLLALLVAAVLGIPAGLIAGRYRDLSYAVDPLLNALNATPQVALVPLVVRCLAFPIEKPALPELSRWAKAMESRAAFAVATGAKPSALNAA